MPTPDRKLKTMTNPQIRVVEIGIRELRKISIYPLSMHDQMDLTDDVNSVLADFFAASEDDNEIAFASFFVELIRENIPRILKLITYEEDIDKLLKELTNYQVTEMAKIVFEENYETVLKNLKSLFGGIEKISQLERPSQPSVTTSEATESNTSSGSDTKKEE